MRAGRLVGASGFEPPTSRSRTVRSNQAELCPDVTASLKPRGRRVHSGQNLYPAPNDTISGRTRIFSAEPVPGNVTRDFVSIGT